MDKLDIYALDFPSFYYQSKRGKIKCTDVQELETAISFFVDLFEDLTSNEKSELTSRVRTLISSKNILDLLKTKWFSIADVIIKHLQAFREDTSLGLDEDTRIIIANQCDPTFLTSTIFIDDNEFEKFLKLYYDIQKQCTVHDKIANHISIKEEFITQIIEDYLTIHSGGEIQETCCYKYLNCEVPTKKDIVHLLRIYADLFYKNHKNIQAIFKMIFANPHLSLGKGDKPIYKQHQPLDSENPYEL